MGEISRLIHMGMTAAGLTRDRMYTGGMRFTGSLSAAGQNISVAVVFQGESLTTLPRLILTDRARELPQAVAHMERGDRVCYARETDLLLDPFNPEGSVTACLAAMRKALDRIARLDLSEEIAQEFPQHWLAEEETFTAAIWRESSKAFLFRVTRGPHRQILVLAPNENFLRSFGLRETEMKKAKREAQETAVVATSASLTFRHPHRQPTNFAQLIAWANSIDPRLERQIVDELAVQDKGHLSIFIAGPNGVVGAALTVPTVLRKSVQRQDFLRWVLNHRGAEIPLVRLSGARADEEFMFTRNLGQQPNLSEKRIAIIGMGTIGGALAKLIAQSGAGLNRGRLVLFDTDILTPGNIGRHILPPSYVGLLKAEACRDFIRSFYPENDIAAVNSDALARIDELNAFDLVIDATGDEAVAANINRYFFQRRAASNSAPVWMHLCLFGNGVAAQGLLVDSPEYACYQCQKLPDGAFRFPVLRSDHPAILTPANCNEGSYFAYGVGAPTIAAGLGVQMALDWTAGKPSPRLRTVRIVQDATQTVKDQNPSKRPGCFVCGSH